MHFDDRRVTDQQFQKRLNTQFFWIERSRYRGGCGVIL
jgi:hypothetical protein